MPFKSPSSWVRHVQRLPGMRFDNVVLGTGPEGIGKSLTMIKLLKAIDPTFGPDRIWFDWEDFRDCALDLKPAQAVLWDEMKLSKFRQGSRQSEEFRSFVQEKRGLRLHMGFNIPHWEIMDPNLIPLRVRWNVKVESRGIWTLRKPLRRRDPEGEESMEWHWHSLNRWPMKEPRGPLIDEYTRRKNLHMRGRTIHYRDLYAPPEEVVRDLGYSSAGFDPGAADAIWHDWDQRPVL